MGAPITSSKPTKPVLKVTGEDNSVTDLVNAAASALTNVGQDVELHQMIGRVEGMTDFNEVLIIVKEYCEIEN